MGKKNEIFGERLKKMRGKIKKNQLDVAKSLGISRSRYSHYENNHVEPDIDMIRKIADYFGVTTDYLLGRSTDWRLTEEEEVETDKEVEELLAIIDSWPEDKQKTEIEKILSFAKFITNDKIDGSND